MIKIQKEDFNLENEIAFIKSQHNNIGAVSTFVGYVKNITNTDSEEFDEPSIQDIDSLKKFLCNKYPKLDPYINKEEVVRFAINLEYTATNEKLSLCDEVALFPPVSGG